MAQKLTIYQRLGKLFGPEGPRTTQPTYQKFKLDSKDILKTDSKAAFERAQLQAQQTMYLANQWTKVDNELYTQSIYYEPTRLASYYDYESMEFTPEISAALDIFSEEGTTPSEKGYTLTLYSESVRIKSILADLFNNILDVDTNLPMWIRNTPIKYDTIIPLLNGEEITIKELSERVKNNNGEDIWTYSIQDGTNKVVPGKIVWCDLTRKSSELIRVYLDNETYTDTTPDHEYILRDGKSRRADELKEGDSLMPFYTKMSKERNVKGYEKIYDPNINRYEYTHRVVAKDLLIDQLLEDTSDDYYVTHHVNFDKLNNDPSNLRRMTSGDHTTLHNEHSKILEHYRILPEVVEKRMTGIGRYLRSDERRERLSKEMSGIYPKFFEEYNNSELHVEHNKNRSEFMLSSWGDDEFISKTRKGMTINLSDEAYSLIEDIISSRGEYLPFTKLVKELKLNDEFIGLLKSSNTIKRDLKKTINNKTLRVLINRKTGKDYFELIKDLVPSVGDCPDYKRHVNISRAKTKVTNHKVMRVVKLEETADVYCMEVRGPNGESDRHNFPVCSKNLDGEHNRDGVFLSNCKYGDNFVYLKVDPEKGVIGCNQLPNIEIERVESGEFPNTAGGETDDKKRQLKFHWRDKNLEFNSWELAHFRLLGDDRRLPYGTSILEKARRIWKQLLLAEDAMLVYRTSRAPERRVFKVFVGNMDDKDVEAYVQKVANKFKRDPVVDPSNGNVDLRYNQMAVDQDFFIPVRDPASPNPIETLPGAQNLSEIADIEYIQKKLLAALRIPKAFLGFEEVVGEGRNLALLDIRFARTINRIQKSIIQELNKIAIIHLYVLGFEEELDNFALGLTNPSTQAELLKVEQWKEKITLYRDAVTDPGNGIQAVSSTWAKKNILGMSDEEVKLDLQQQRFEKAISKELEDTATIIKKTGVFNTIDKLYGDIESGEEAAGEEGNEDEFATGAEGMEITGGAEPEFEAESSDTMAPEAAAEGYKVERDLPLILENKGIELPTLTQLTKKTRKTIDELNKQVDDLVNE